MLKNLSVLAAIGMLAGAASAGSIISVGGVQEYGTLFSMHIGQEYSTKFDTYGTTSGSISWWRESDDTGYLMGGRPDAGTVTWHLQTDAGTVFSDDITVYAFNIIFGGTGTGSYIKGEWSSDNVNWNQFSYLEDLGDGQSVTDPVPYTYTLDFEGGTDLYLRYSIYRTTDNNWVGVQLFRSGADTPGLVISGSVVEVPEAATLGVLGAAVLPMMMRRKR